MTVTQARHRLEMDRGPGRSLRPLRPYVRRHSRELGRGTAYTLVLVASRLALPLPLGGIVGQTSGPAPDTGQVTWMGAGFAALAVLGGAGEYAARLAFANFANRTVGDIRDAASATAGDRSVAELVADSARLKAALKGVLNHIVVNALLVLGATVAVLVADAVLGLALLAGVLVLVALGRAGAVRVSPVAEAHRAEEAAVGDTVHQLAAERPETWTEEELTDLHRRNQDSGVADVGLTALEGRVTWIAHVLLTVTIGLVLFLGARAATEGTLSPAELFMVGGFLLTLHGPAVRLVRQLVRVGGVRVNARHLAAALPGAPTRPDNRDG